MRVLFLFILYFSLAQAITINLSVTVRCYIDIVYISIGITIKTNSFMLVIAYRANDVSKLGG
jgi:hypothetical protein